MKSSAVVAFSLVVLFGVETAASRDGWFAVSDEVMGHGTATCAIGATDGFCFGLRCNADNPQPGMEWFVWQDGGRLPDAPAEALVCVDSEQCRSLPMTPVTAGGWPMMVSSFAPGTHDPLVADLAAGGKVIVVLENEARSPMTLRNSRSELRRAIAACNPRGRTG